MDFTLPPSIRMLFPLRPFSSSRQATPLWTVSIAWAVTAHEPDRAPDAPQPLDFQLSSSTLLIKPQRPTVTPFQNVSEKKESESVVIIRSSDMLNGSTEPEPDIASKTPDQSQLSVNEPNCVAVFQLKRKQSLLSYLKNSLLVKQDFHKNEVLSDQIFTQMIEITRNSSFLKESYVKTTSCKVDPTADETNFNLETCLLIQGFAVSILLAAIYCTVKTGTINNRARSGFNQKALVLAFFILFLLPCSHCSIKTYDIGIFTKTARLLRPWT